MKLNAVLRFAREVLVNIAMPFVIFSFAQPRWGDVGALLGASAPPVVWSIVEFVRARKIDALSLVVLTGIGLSIAVYLGGGSVRFIQLREKLVTIFIGFIFLGSAAIGKPLMYELIRAFMRRNGDSELQDLEARRNERGVKQAMTLMTLVWGFGLLADGTASAALVYVLPIPVYLVVNPILGYATIGTLTLWTVFYGRRRRRLRLAQKAESAVLV
jgi:hypothetical protein